MNAKDQEYVDEIRKRISHFKTNLTDFDLLRWLSYYDYSIDTIIPKLKKNISITISSHLERFQEPQVLRTYYLSGTTGFSKTNHTLIAIQCLGKLDNNGVQNSVTCTQFFRFLLKEQITMLNKIREYEETTKQQAKLLVILDCQDMRVDLQFLKFLTTAYKLTADFVIENFGDMYSKFVVINVPNNAAYLWKIVKTFIPSKGVQKVDILFNDWKTEILKYVDADVLPIHWGGQLVDKNGDEMCRSMITIPDKIPEHYYWEPGPDDIPLSELTTLRVKPGKVKFVTVKVDKVGAMLEWYCLIQGGFGMGVYFTDDADEKNVDFMEMVFPDFEFFPLGTGPPESDAIECSKMGFYKLRFSNKASWITTTIVQYKVWLKT